MSCLFRVNRYTHKSLSTAIRKHLAPKKCAFIEDIKTVKKVYKDINTAVSGMHVLNGIKLVACYVDGKLAYVHTMTKKYTAGADVTRYFMHNQVIPHVIPFTHTLLQVFGKLVLTVDQYISLCIRSKAVNPLSLHCLIKLDRVPLEWFKFFPYSTNIYQTTFSKDFAPFMESLGFVVPFKPYPLDISLEGLGDKDHIYSIPGLQDIVPQGGRIEYEGEYYHWDSFWVFADRMSRWRYPKLLESLYSRHCFCVPKPSQCDYTTVESVRRFVTAQGLHLAVLSLTPVKINGFIVRKTNMVSQADLDKYGIDVGSNVLMTVKHGCTPHLILPDKADQYNVYRA